MSLDTKITIQQDSAGGHAIKSPAYLKLVELYADAGIEVTLQPTSSPECNMCDGGFWHMLKSRITKRCSEIPDKGTAPEKYIQDRMWQIAVEEWNNFNPINLLIISQQKLRVFEKIVELQGEPIIFEPHTGIRKKIKITG